MKHVEELRDQEAQELLNGEFEIFMNYIAPGLVMAVDAVVNMAGDELPEDPADIEALRQAVYNKFEAMFEAAMLGGFVVGAKYGQTHEEETSGGTEG